MTTTAKSISEPEQELELELVECQCVCGGCPHETDLHPQTCKPRTPAPNNARPEGMSIEEWATMYDLDGYPDPMAIVLCVGCRRRVGAAFQALIGGSLYHGYCADCLADARGKPV